MKGVADCYKKNLAQREVQTCLNYFEELVKNLSEEDILFKALDFTKRETSGRLNIFELENI